MAPCRRLWIQSTQRLLALRARPRPAPGKMNSWHGRTHEQVRAFTMCAAQSSFALAWPKGAGQVRTVPRKQLRISLSLNSVRSSLIMASAVLEATWSTLGSKQCAAGKRDGRMVKEC